MSIYASAFRARGRQAPSDRGERRGFKIPGLSKLRIGGSIGKATEAIKHAKIAGVPVFEGIQAATGNPVGAFETARDGGSLKEGAQNFGNDLVQGAKNVPMVLAGTKLFGNTGGTPSIPGLPGGGGGSNSSAGGADWLDLVLGGASAYNAAKLGEKSEKYVTGASDMALQNWKEREPLRLAGVAGMLDPKPSSDLSGLSQVASKNAFAPKKPPLVMGGA